MINFASNYHQLITKVSLFFILLLVARLYASPSAINGLSCQAVLC